MRCFKCQRFGHLAAQCRGKLRCAKCGSEHEYGQCGDNTELKCCNCGGQHSVAYGGCVKQKEAKEVQKYKITHKVSYAEAIKNIVKKKKEEKLALIYLPEQRISDDNRSNPIRESNRNPTGKITQKKTHRPPVPNCCKCKTRISE